MGADYFDYQAVAGQAGLNAEQLDRLSDLVRRDFPSDPMLFELHLYRAYRAIRDGVVRVEQVLGAASRTLPGCSSEET